MDTLDKPCLPREWERENHCDVSRLTYRYNIRLGNRLVQCTTRYRIERCTEGYVLGDLLHSTTLFPGEEVFMSVRNRHSIARFTEDKSFSASQMSRTSERVWMETYKNLATDFDQTTSGSANSSSHSEFSETGGGGGGGINLFGIIKIGGGVSHVSGDFDASSSSEFETELNQHMQSSFHQTNQVARDTMSVSLTEVNSHRESTAERDDELKVSTRRFKNINQCHTVTHYFYQIAKRQRVKIIFEGRTCRAVNQIANTEVSMKPFIMSIGVNRQISAEKNNVGTGAGTVLAQPVLLAAQAQPLASQQLTVDQISLKKASNISLEAFQMDEKTRVEAVAQVNTLVAKLPKPEVFEQVSLIPTEALYVESEVGGCSVCEPYVMEKQKLELERLELENEKLKKETELLEQFKDYRCCGDEEDKGAGEDDTD